VVAEAGFEPRDLRLMRPASYRTALLRVVQPAYADLAPPTGLEPAFSA
jgi:hypothetical protein